MQRPIPTSTLLRFPVLFGSFLAFVGLGLYYKESWIGDVEKTRREILERSDIQNNPIQDFKREVASKR